jgi:hypothetical protein
MCMNWHRRASPRDVIDYGTPVTQPLIRCLLIPIAVALLWSQPTLAASSPKKKEYQPKPAIPKIGEEEYHSRLVPIALPGHRKGKTPSKGYMQIIMTLVVITGDEDHMIEVCDKSMLYSDALLTEFHKTPVALTKRGGFSDKAGTISRISRVIDTTLGNELVTGLRLASENVKQYAEESLACRR